MLGGLTPKKIIAAGESQSAGRMVTYIDAVHPLVHVYDGFLVHSRGAAGARSSQSPSAAVHTPSPTLIRNDLDVPVFVFETETDVFNSNTGRPPARHATGSGSGRSRAPRTSTSTASRSARPTPVTARARSPTSPRCKTRRDDPGPRLPCDLPINTGGTHWVLERGASTALNQWVVNGIAPPTAALLRSRLAVPDVLTTRVHKDAKRQHAGRRALTAGGCTNRRARRHRQQGPAFCGSSSAPPDSVRPGPARRALQEPRAIRLPWSRRHPERRQRRIPAPARRQRTRELRGHVEHRQVGRSHRSAHGPAARAAGPRRDCAALRNPGRAVA